MQIFKSIIILVILYLLFKNKNKNKLDLIMAPSTLKNAGNGMFALRNFSVGVTVEICPYLTGTLDEFKGEIIDYYIQHHTKENSVILPLGYCAMYNHSPNPNLELVQNNDEDNLKAIVIRNIRKGDELFITYGDEWWASRELNYSK